MGLQINQIYQGDCITLMKEIQDKSVDMILCDLPYGVTARNKWDVIIPFEPLWQAYERIIKDNGAICLTATEPFSSMLIMSNIKLFRYDLIWEKPLATGFLNANRMPLRNHEQILIFYKKLPLYNPQKTEGKPYSMTRRGDSSNYNEVNVLNWETNNLDGKRFPKSVIRFAADKDKLHPTQKPLELFKYLINTYTNEGDLVLDNCLGSGTTTVAAKQLKRNYIGIELSKEYCTIAYNRLKEIT